VITVVGLGKIGLPLAVQFARKGQSVLGVDVNSSTVQLVNNGTEPFPGEANLAGFLQETVVSGLLRAGFDTAHAVGRSDVVVVTVPLFVNDKSKPDYSAMDSATCAIGRGLQPGTLVAFETTLPVGTTRNRLAPILERESGLKAGKDFYVVFSPERVFTGRVFEDLRKYPKLVGGINQESEERGRKFYESVLDFDDRPDLDKPNGVWTLGSSEAAELAKLAETTYRDVNIALANQFALHAEKICVDIYPVIEACNSQSFSHIHQPGVSVGGHCIPVYPHLYLAGDPEATVVSAAREANLRMPIRAVEIVERELGTLVNKKVAILGLSYRGGVKESAFSGAWDLVREIRARGGVPLVHDGYYSEEELTNLGLSEYVLGSACDGAIVHTAHAEYMNLVSSDLPGAKILFDGRNITTKSLRDSIRIRVIGVGN
jgi:nucleotide sugar dehydrogenase